MNYWLLIIMMLVAVLAAAVALADDDGTPVSTAPAEAEEREDPIEYGDL